MKLIFIFLFNIWALSLSAQSFHDTSFVIKIKHLNGSVRYDTLRERDSGRRFVACVIPDQFERNVKMAVDSIAYAQKRVLSYQFTPPQYDSLVETIALRPAYSFYEINEKATLHKAATLIPPTWEIASEYVMMASAHTIFARFTGLSPIGSASDADCVGFVVFEEPTSYVRTYRRVLKTPAFLAQIIDNQKVVDTLQLPSPYLKETKVASWICQKTTYTIREPLTITVRSSTPTVPNNISGLSLIKAGGLSELREYIVCGGVGDDSTALAIQKSLRHLGYRVKLNNTIDRRTKRALRAFQKRQHLPIGNLNLATLERLEIKPFENVGSPAKQMIDPFKNTQYRGLDTFKEFIYLQALTDVQITERTGEKIQRIRVCRQALGIEEIKKQVVPFRENEGKY